MFYYQVAEDFYSTICNREFIKGVLYTRKELEKLYKRHIPEVAAFQLSKNATKGFFKLVELKKSEIVFCFGCRLPIIGKFKLEYFDGYWWKPVYFQK